MGRPRKKLRLIGDFFSNRLQDSFFEETGFMDIMSALWHHGRMRVVVLSIVGLMVLFIAGCAAPPKQAVTASPVKSGYYVAILNKTPHGITNVSVHFGATTVASERVCAARAQANFGPLTLPIPPTVELQWTDEDGSHTVHVQNKGVISQRLGADWTIYFAINEGGLAQARVIKFGDSAAFADLMEWVQPSGQYRFGFVNHSERNLKAVSVYYDGRPVGTVGDVTAQAQAAVYTDAVRLPIPVSAEVRWNEGGVAHAVQARLAGTVPRSFSDGTILFVITQDGMVEVKPVEWNGDKGSTNSEN